MKITKCLLALFFFSFSNFLFGQNLSLKGKIVDEKTNDPLPYATLEIFSLKTGTIANANGEFAISVNVQNVAIDTMEFSFLGYNRKKISLQDFIESNEKEVKLSVNTLMLKELVVVPSKYKIVKIGIVDRKRQGEIGALVDYKMVGNHINNSAEKRGYVKSVSFYIGKEGIQSTPFRIRIFDLNNEKMSPGNDLLTKDLVVSAKKSGWFKVDLTDCNVPFPLDGMFVVMEWINTGGKYIYEEEGTKLGEDGQIVKYKHVSYGQTIGIIMKSEGITWETTLGKDWVSKKKNSRFPYKGLYPTAI